jgi:hypothetical protein
MMTAAIEGNRSMNEKKHNAPPAKHPLRESSIAQGDVVLSAPPSVDDAKLARFARKVTFAKTMDEAVEMLLRAVNKRRGSLAVTPRRYTETIRNWLRAMWGGEQGLLTYAIKQFAIGCAELDDDSVHAPIWETVLAKKKVDANGVTVKGLGDTKHLREQWLESIRAAKRGRTLKRIREHTKAWNAERERHQAALGRWQAGDSVVHPVFGRGVVSDDDGVLRVAYEQELCGQPLRMRLDLVAGDLQLAD